MGDKSDVANSGDLGHDVHMETTQTFPNIDQLRAAPNYPVARTVTNIIATLSARDGGTKQIRLFTNFISEGVREIIGFSNPALGSPYTLIAADADGTQYLSNWYASDMFPVWWMEG